MKRKTHKIILAGIGIFLLLFLLSGTVKRYLFPQIEVFRYGSDIDLSKDLGAGVPVLYQWDDRWAGCSYGSSTMEISGCGPTCLSMVWCGLNEKGDWDPYRVAKMAEKNGYYVDGTGTSWALMTEGAKKMGLHGQEEVFTKNNILETLRQGRPIIVSVGPGDFTDSGHFIVLTGVTKDDRLIIHDPNSRKNSEKTWDIEQVMGQVKNLWSYSLM